MCLVKLPDELNIFSQYLHLKGFLSSVRSFFFLMTQKDYTCGIIETIYGYYPNSSESTCTCTPLDGNYEEISR